MSTVSWTTPGTSGSWLTASNWSTGALPTATDTVTLGAGSAAYDVAIGTAPASAASLTLVGKITGAGALTELTLAAQTLTVGSTVTLANAETSIDGAGTLSAGGAISGTGTIMAGQANTGGLLDVTGAGSLVSGVQLAIDAAAPSTLELDLGAVVAAPIAITSANQTLEIGGAGQVTLAAAESISRGTIALQPGATLTADAGLTLGTGAVLTGAGVVTTGTTAGTDIEGKGTILASGGRLEILGGIDQGPGGATALMIGSAPNTVLDLEGPLGRGAVKPQISFTGGTSELYLGSLAGFQGTVSNFTAGESIVVAGATSEVLNNNGKVMTVYAGTTVLGTINLTQSQSGSSLTVSGGVITTSQQCFAAGSRILTPEGERVVEELQEGDPVLTAGPDGLTTRRLVWVGHLAVDLARHPHPQATAPIRIRRGAFAEDVPHRDLWLSPDHCVFVDGRLVAAKCLVNAMTIVQEAGRTKVVYHHIETDPHAVVLAEGLPVETYLDTGNRAWFDNAGAALMLHPEFHVNARLRCWETDACAPLATDPAVLEPIWRRLAARAEALGHVRPDPLTTDEPALRLLVEGQELEPIAHAGTRYSFLLARGGAEATLLSRRDSPATLRPWDNDHRRLGVAVARIVLRAGADEREIPVDHPGLSSGWHPVERDDATHWRWTDGRGRILLDDTRGPAILDVYLTGAMRYGLPAAETLQLAA